MDRKTSRKRCLTNAVYFFMPIYKGKWIENK